MYLQVIPYEGESVRPNENLEKFSVFTYHNKYDNIDMLLYDKVLNALKKLDTSYNPKMTRIHKLVIEGNYKVMGDTRVIPIVEHKDEEIQWDCSTSISTDTGEADTLKEVMTSPNRICGKFPRFMK